MNEKIYTTKKNGMVVLLAELLVYALAITGIVLFAISYENYPRTGTFVLMVLCIVVTAIAWIPLCGLRMDSVAWSQSAEAAGSTCADTVW